MWPNPKGYGPKTGFSRKIYLWTYDLGPVAATAAVLELIHNPIFPSYHQNMVCRNPDITKWIGLTSTSKLLPLIKLVLNHKCKSVSFNWDRLLARNLTGWATRSSAWRKWPYLVEWTFTFSAVNCDDIQIALYPRHFYRTCLYRSQVKVTIPEKP